MDENWTVEKLAAQEIHVWCSLAGNILDYGVTLYTKSKRDGIVIGYENEDLDEEILGYFIGDKSKTEVPIIEAVAVDFAPRRKIDRADSYLEAHLECVRRARASLELIVNNLSSMGLGSSIKVEDRLRESAYE